MLAPGLRFLRRRFKFSAHSVLWSESHSDPSSDSRWQLLQTHCSRRARFVTTVTLILLFYTFILFYLSLTAEPPVAIICV